jgi:transposase
MTLLDRIAQLEEGRKTPQHSSLPPSTQHPHNRPQAPKRKSKKKRGGQPGHKKHEWPLIPTDECDDVHRLRPTECRRCGAKLSDSDPEPLRHQVGELPAITPTVTECQRHRLTCPCCGETMCAELPGGVVRQWRGRAGKVDNCQVGVYMPTSLATSRR